MKLQITQRQVVTPGQRTSVMRDLNAGKETFQALSGAGDALTKLGLQIHRKLKAAEDTLEYTDLLTDAKGEVSKFYTTRSKDIANASTLTDDVADFIKGQKTKALEGITDVTQQARVSQGFSALSDAYHTKSITDATAAAVDGINADMVITRAKMIQDAGSGDDDHMSSVMLSFAGIQRNMAKSGIITQEKAETELMDFASDAANTRVRSMMNTDPVAAKAYLDDPTTFSKLINTEHREILSLQAQRLIDTRERQSEADRKAIITAEDKALKMTRDAIYQQSVKGIADDVFTPAELENYREANLLHKADYEKLRTMMMKRHIDMVGDPKIQKGMQERMVMGTLTTNEVLAAFNDEQLNWEMTQEFLTGIENGSVLVNDDRYRSRLFSLKTMLGWSPMGGMGDNESLHIARATMQFRDRVIAGEDVDEVYNDLIARFTKTQASALEKPRYKSLAEAKKNLKPGSALDREIYLQEQAQLRVQEEAAFNKRREAENGE